MGASGGVVHHRRMHISSRIVGRQSIIEGKRFFNGFTRDRLLGHESAVRPGRIHGVMDTSLLDKFAQHYYFMEIIKGWN